VCPVCLEDIKPDEKLTLKCGHAFHGDKCLRNWAGNEYNNVNDMVQPMKTRKISFFREKHNIFKCPSCREEYTFDIYDNNEIKKYTLKSILRIRATVLYII